MARYNPSITVCDKCFRASCWQGEFMCDDAHEAGITDRPVSNLISRDAGEHPEYWNKHLDIGHERLLMVSDLRALGLKEPESGWGEIARG